VVIGFYDHPVRIDVIMVAANEGFGLFEVGEETLGESVLLPVAARGDDIAGDRHQIDIRPGVDSGHGLFLLWKDIPREVDVGKDDDLKLALVRGVGLVCFSAAGQRDSDSDRQSRREDQKVFFHGNTSFCKQDRNEKDGNGSG